MSVGRAVRREPALIVICAIGVALRLAWLFQPIRYDESVTYLGFVRGGVVNVVTNYDVPNNHVFHSLLVWLTTRTSSSLWAIRMPAFVAGALAPVATYLVGRRLHGRDGALFGAALVACSAHLIEYSTNARGYSIITLFALGQAILADRIVRDARHRDLGAFALVTALGLFTVPTMAYPTLATLAWAAIVAVASRRAMPWRTLAWRVPTYAAICASLTIALYLPILLQQGGFENLTANRWVASIDSLDRWRRAMGVLGGQLVDEWSLGLTKPGLTAVVGLALAGAIVGVVRRRDARASWAIVASVVLVATCFAQRVAPFARVFGFALPMLLLAAGAGAIELLRVARLARFATGLAIVACAALAMVVVVGRAPDRAGAADKFPDAAAVEAFLAPRAGDAIIYGVVPSAAAQYVAFREGREPFGYRRDAARLWIVTRADVPPAETMQSRTNRLRPEDFDAPRLAFTRGVAQVYEATPRDGRTPEPQRKRRR